MRLCGTAYGHWISNMTMPWYLLFYMNEYCNSQFPIVNYYIIAEYNQSN
jgi:hypothetical protein